MARLAPANQSTLTRLTLNYVMARDARSHLRAMIGISEYLGALGNSRAAIEEWLSYSDELLPEDSPVLSAAIETEAIILGAQGRLRPH